MLNLRDRTVFTHGNQKHTETKYPCYISSFKRGKTGSVCFPELSRHLNVCGGTREMRSQRGGELSEHPSKGANTKLAQNPLKKETQHVRVTVATRRHSPGTTSVVLERAGKGGHGAPQDLRLLTSRPKRTEALRRGQAGWKAVNSQRGDRPPAAGGGGAAPAPGTPARGPTTTPRQQNRHQPPHFVPERAPHNTKQPSSLFSEQGCSLKVLRFCLRKENL